MTATFLHPVRCDWSVVLPCLDEEETLPFCLAEIDRTLSETGESFEIVVADNGSRDGSRAIAKAAGATVVDCPVPGYGACLRAGILGASGRCVAMGDADGSYDFTMLPRLFRALQDDPNALILGCRMPSGGGSIAPGAMPWSHRYIGNPGLSAIARRLFADLPTHDIYTGQRAFSRATFARLDPRQPGFDFSIETVLRAVEEGIAVVDVPVVLRPDGRTQHGPHLQRYRDGRLALQQYARFFWRRRRRRATQGPRP